MHPRYQPQEREFRESARERDTERYNRLRARGASDTKRPRENAREGERGKRDFFVDNLLVRIHSIVAMIWWTGLAPWEFEFPFPVSLTLTFHQTHNTALNIPLHTPPARNKPCTRRGIGTASRVSKCHPALGPQQYTANPKSFTVDPAHFLLLLHHSQAQS